MVRKLSAELDGGSGPDARADDPTAPPRLAPPTEEEMRELLVRHQGNVAAIGRELGKARMQVHRWLVRYGIDIDDFRA